MKSIIEVSRTVTHKLAALFFSVMAAAVPLQQVFATGVAGSKIATGTERLIKDVTTWLIVLAPIAAGLLIIYFCIRRSAADEMDSKKWSNRIVVAVVSCIGAVLGSATLNLVLTYYS